MARNLDCSLCLETVSHKTQQASEYMRFFFSKTKTLLLPFFMIHFEEVAVPGLQSLWGICVGRVAANSLGFI